VPVSPEGSNNLPAAPKDPSTDVNCDSSGICYDGELQQLQLYVSAGTRILGDTYHLSPRPVSVIYIPLQSLVINLIPNFRRLPFTQTSILVELPSLSSFELPVPNDPRRSSPPDAKLEVAVTVTRIKLVLL
jgi:hypothetical protein